MPIASSVFKEIIIRELATKAPNPVLVEQLYETASRELIFDSHDLNFTTHKSEITGDLNWKRNLRNCLQSLKTRGEVVNSTKGYWRLPSFNQETFLDADEAWMLIKRAAEEASVTNISWSSVKQGHRYRVSSIEENKIVIKRESRPTLENLYKSDVERAIKSLNTAGGTLGRRTMIYVVAKEVAIVNFHPSLQWAKDGEFIITSKNEAGLIKLLVEKFEEAESDDIYTFQKYARRIRKGQKKLRENLLKVYNSSCCVSRCGLENVLQAAHIEPHSSKGNNMSTNALLLRSDIHDLFDDGLLLIHPESLRIFVHPSLGQTDYYKYDGIVIVERSDNLKPDGQKLRMKWNNDIWDKSKILT